MKDKVICEQLSDQQGNLICDEFYYQFYEGVDFNPIWHQGLKKVYDAKDKSGNYSIEDAINYMDDDQETMLAIFNEMIGKELKNGVLTYVYVNYIQNDDGSDNLIKQIMLAYLIGENNHLVIRAPFYAFTDYAKNDLMNKIRKEYE